MCFVHSGHIGGSACGCDPVCFIDRCDGSRNHASEKAEKSGRTFCLLNSTKLWVVSEIMLFVLVGATVNIKYALSAGFAAVVLIFGVLAFRMAGVFFCLLKTGLNRKERTFCMIAYMPKATVQAAIGGIPLAMGLSCGNIVLTVAVVSILITAPLARF